jgi:hypothetical protein
MRMIYGSFSICAAASTTSVTVRITDVNDEPPVFVPETLLAAVAEEAAFETTVTTLRVCFIKRTQTMNRD